MGSNMAENHPAGFQWVVEARERGAKIIHVDPRFTRTSAMADLWVPLRAGSDILFLGGLVNYAITHDKFFRDYVVNFTNAPVILRDDMKDPEENDGVWSGWNEEKKKYDPKTWAYAGASAGGNGDSAAGHSEKKRVAKAKNRAAQLPPPNMKRITRSKIPAAPSRR